MATSATHSEQLPAAPASAAEEKKHGPARKPGSFFFLFGVILPLLALIFETTTHYCAQHFFDPFPSTAHILLFLLIPVTNFMTWLASRRDLSAFYLFIALGNGMALGIGCLYTLMFLPISGTACLGILFLGFGLLAFAPLLSVPCSWLAGKSVCSLAANRSTFFDAHQMEHIGHLVVLIMVVAIELPSTLTRVYLGEAVDTDSAKSQAAIGWLRKYGSQEVMLRACYERSGRATDILGSIAEHVHPVSAAQARSIFYKVTGKPFNSVPIPASARATIKHTSLVDDPADLNAGVQDEFDYDADIAGETVSGTARGLSVSASKLSGTIDPDALLAVMNWTFTFENSSKYDREARCKILLPPGAVATKAVMIVDGIAHEAQIQERQAARQTYTEAVKARKNPLLVSVCGQDQILVQCYPIRNGSDIKVSLKIVAPATLGEDASQATLVLPSFSEKNFQADVPLQTDELKSVGRSQFSRFDAVLRLQRNPNCKSVYCQDSWTDLNSTVVRFISPEQHQTPERLVVVVDGSLQMKGRLAEVVAGLQALPQTVPTEVVLVSDKDQFLCKSGTKPGDPAFKQALQTLIDYQPVGGQDDSIVVRALARGKAKPGTQVLWIHGAQPTASEFGSGGVKYFLQQAGMRPLLYDLQVAPGPNEYLAFADTYPSLISVAPTGSISGDLKRLFSTWTSKPDTVSPRYMFIGTGVAGATAASQQTLPELGQLWAFDNVLRCANSPNSDEQSEAAALAVQYHLITPASSAIVVEDIPQLAGEILAPPPIVDQWLAKLNLQGYIDESFNKISNEFSRQVADIEVAAPAPVVESQEELAYKTSGSEYAGSQKDQERAEGEMGATTSGATSDNFRLGRSGAPIGSIALDKPMAGAPAASPGAAPSVAPSARMAGGGGAGYANRYAEPGQSGGFGGGAMMSVQANMNSSDNTAGPASMYSSANSNVGPIGRARRESIGGMLRARRESVGGMLRAKQTAAADEKKKEAEKHSNGLDGSDGYYRGLEITERNNKYDQLVKEGAINTRATASADAGSVSSAQPGGGSTDGYIDSVQAGGFQHDLQSGNFFTRLLFACIFWVMMLIGFGGATSLMLVLVRNARKDPVPAP